jgi:hypothetical protein
MKVPANAKMGDVIHTIEVPAKFAKHRDHYIRGYMRGYVGRADALAARRRFLEGPKKASHADRRYGTPERQKPESRVTKRLRTGVD